MKFLQVNHELRDFRDLVTANHLEFAPSHGPDLRLKACLRGLNGRLIVMDLGMVRRPMFSLRNVDFDILMVTKLVWRLALRFAVLFFWMFLLKKSYESLGVFVWTAGGEKLLFTVKVFFDFNLKTLHFFLDGDCYPGRKHIYPTRLPLDLSYLRPCRLTWVHLKITQNQHPENHLNHHPPPCLWVTRARV